MGADNNIFGAGKGFIIGMVHCAPLLGTPGFCGDFDAVVARAAADALTLEKAGCDAVCVENMGDAPFAALLDTEQLCGLSIIAAAVKNAVRLPVGIDAAFNDCKASLSIARLIGGAFVRIPVFVDTVVFYGGAITPCARECMQFRQKIGAQSVKVFADIHVKHTHMLLSRVTVEDSARAACECGADAVIVTGTRIGAQTPLETVSRVKNAVKIPVIIGSGVNKSNIAEQLKVGDGAIIGSGLKEDGDINNPVSLKLAKELIQQIKK
ncbi:MAG: BtpA/SgcQ family protein [Clostridiales bacterium]|jgi:membrane complex biogenesis BtpA family protein|nr:BtpA/SgcQ family protein [Clostridiales bacterium]